MAAAPYGKFIVVFMLIAALGGGIGTIVQYGFEHPGTRDAVVLGHQENMVLVQANFGKTAKPIEPGMKGIVSFPEKPKEKFPAWVKSIDQTGQALLLVRKNGVNLKAATGSTCQASIDMTLPPVSEASFLQ